MARPKLLFLRHWRELALTGLGLLMLAGARADEFAVRDLAGGMNDSVPANLIADNEASVITNLHVDPISRGLIQRGGSSKVNTTQLSGSVAVDIFSHVQSDGDSYLLSVASRTVSYSETGGATWTTLITTATLNSVWDGETFVDDNFYMVNQDDGGWFFNGTAFARAGSMPSGKYLEPYQNRVFVANTAATPYRLFFSGLLQPSTWTVSTDFIDFPEAITGIGKPFDGGLPIYTFNTTWMLRGTGPSNFYVQQISGQVGAAENRDIKNFIINDNEYQVFFSLGPNRSRKSLYALTGDSVVDLGRKVPRLFNEVAVFESSARVLEWNTDEDFALGTTSITYISETEEAVKLSTSTDVDDDATDFGAGTTSNTSLIGDVVYLSTNNANLSNNGFESGSTGWTLAGVAALNTFCSPRTGTQWGSFSTPVSAFQILTVGGTLLQSTAVSAFGNCLNGTYSANTVSMSSFVGRWVRLRVLATGGSFTSDPFLASGSDITIYYSLDTDSAGVSAFDDITDGRSTIFSGTFTSAAFDTGFSSAAFLTSTASWTTNGHDVSVQTQESADGSSWSTAVSWSTGSAPSSVTWQRFKRYVVTLSTGGTTNGTALPFLSGVGLAARSATGTYTSEIRDGRLGISSLDAFIALTSGGGSHSFSYRTGASEAAVGAASYTSISSGGDVTGSDQFFQWKDDFSMVVSTDDPTLEMVTQNYTVAAGASQPGDMEVWNNDLWMTYTTTDGDHNDSIIVMNPEGKFSKFEGLTVYGFAAHSAKLLAGTSVRDGSTGGFVRQLDVGSTDDGDAVSSSVLFKHHDFSSQDSDLADWRKILSHVYFNYGDEAGTFTAAVFENFNDESTSYTVDFSAGNTVNRWRLEADPGTTAKQFGMGFSNTRAGSKLRLYPPMNFHYTKQKPIPQ